MAMGFINDMAVLVILAFIPVPRYRNEAPLVPATRGRRLLARSACRTHQRRGEFLVAPNVLKH
eukprot:CAMPEP_0179436620 /NCGR_PEP_ID=MMETSP0799-20121207/20590_1 /TAXON_ID=46947 /ORGANISM="Geminigera cryophila, Strain CCMP2564" /LENGTH=62 /DNA_ID=CAMNT_0021216893 /DNA_START=199 /DNA_END=384 /DNA_ORIENTATION=-